MRKVRVTQWVPVLLIGLLLGAEARGEPDEQTSYTPAELQALDRALEAANLTREDLTFRKDLAKGHACLELVKAMLRDPLQIAPEIDSLVHAAQTIDKALHPPLGSLVAAHDRLPNKAALGDPSVDAAGLPFANLRRLLDRAAATHPAAGATPENLLAYLEKMASVGGRRLQLCKDIDSAERTPVDSDDPRYRMLRRYLPEQMAWHEVFKSPYSAAVDKALAKTLESEGESHVHDLAARIPVDALIRQWLTTFGDPVAWLSALPTASFPTDKPLIKETPYGRVALGTPGDDTYTGDFAVLIDPGGNDHYVGCRLGAADGTKNRRLGFFADLGGDDVYDCGDVNITLGAAVLGVAAFLDLGAGDDRYTGGHASLGAAMGGVAVFYDDGGSDVYEGRTYTQGAAGFGVGVFHDDATQPRPKTSSDEGTPDPVDIGLFDNDRLRAWSNAQAFARCRGVALCVNRRGNDVYEAGGVYLHAPLFADRYQSFSQGFAIGERGSDYAGGIALIADYEGNDRYLGDIYNQGVGYWYAAGLLYDGGGNDLYEMTQYGQGSGIHLAVGGLVDESGHDTYVMHAGLGQGGSHDYAASILHDRGGNDHYMGMTSCNGCGLTNSVGLHIDRSGNDTYAGREGSINSGRPARGFASVGVLVDLEGKDHYLGIMKDQTAWRHTDFGVGLDLEPAPTPSTEPASGVPTKPKEDAPTVEIPAICNYEGELTQAVFDELWAIAIRWEVGENRHIVPKARARLVAFGAPVLPYLDRAMDKGASGLELRAYQNVLTGLRTADAAAGVTAFLKRNLEHASPRRKRVALWLAGEMKATGNEAEVVALLASEGEGVARRAAGVLQRLGSHAGDERLLAWIADGKDELRVMAALGTLLGLDTACYPAVRSLLEHPLISVRSRLATLLASHHATYGKALGADLSTTNLGTRGRRTVLDVLARTKGELAEATVKTLTGLLGDASWGVRADAARVLQSQLQREDLDAAKRTEIVAALSARHAVEQDPYARFWLRAR